MAGFEWYTMLSALPDAQDETDGMEEWLARLARAGCTGVLVVPPSDDDERLRFVRRVVELCRALGRRCLVFAQPHPAYLRALDELHPDGIVLDADAWTEEGAAALSALGLDAPLGVWERFGRRAAARALCNRQLRRGLEGGRHSLLC